MPLPAGHWLILMTSSQLKLINRSGVIMGLQMQEVNVIKDASCCRLLRKCLFHSFLNVFVELSLSALSCLLMRVFVSCLVLICLTVVKDLKKKDKIFFVILDFIQILSLFLVNTLATRHWICNSMEHISSVKELQNWDWNSWWKMSWEWNTGKNTATDIA